MKSQNVAAEAAVVISDDAASDETLLQCSA